MLDVFYAVPIILVLWNGAVGTKVLVYSVLQRSHVYYELAYGIACTESVYTGI